MKKALNRRNRKETITCNESDNDQNQSEMNFTGTLLFTNLDEMSTRKVRGTQLRDYELSHVQIPQNVRVNSAAVEDDIDIKE